MRLSYGDDDLPTGAAGPGVRLIPAMSSGNALPEGDPRAATACPIGGGVQVARSAQIRKPNSRPTFSGGAPDYLVMQPSCDEIEAPPTRTGRRDRMVVLARRARAGDAYARDELLGLVTDSVSSLARRLVNREAFGSALAEEAANSSLLAISQSIQLLKDPEKIDRWIVAIVRRQVADVVDRESRSGAPLHRRLDDQGELSSGRLSSEAQFELRTLLDQARRELSPGRRQIVELCLEQDLRQEDAATALGCSVGAVKKELHVARAQLKRTLQALEVAPSTGPRELRRESRASDKA